MLMGVVRVPGDLKSVDVSIEAFGPRSSRQDKVVAFKVTTDRALLTDLNESFQVKSRKLKGPGKKRSIELDEDAVADAGADNTKPADNPDAKPADGQAVDANSSGATSSSDDLLDYEIRYDGQAQPVSSDPSSPGELSVPEPKEGQTVTVFLRSKSADRFGVALLFNGTSTLYEEEGDPNHLKAWVMEPGGAYEIRGFQMDNNQIKPFKVLSDADSAAMAYGPNTGLIQFHIYREGTGSLNVADGGSGDDANKAMNISLRGLAHSALARARAVRFRTKKRKFSSTLRCPSRNGSRLVTKNGRVGGFPWPRRPPSKGRFATTRSRTRCSFRASPFVVTSGAASELGLLSAAVGRRGP